MDLNVGVECAVFDCIALAGTDKSPNLYLCGTSMFNIEAYRNEECAQKLLSLSNDEYFIYFSTILSSYEEQQSLDRITETNVGLLDWYTFLCDSWRQDEGYSYLLLALYELGLGFFEKSFTSALKCLDLTPCCFTAWEVLGRSMSHLPNSFFQQWPDRIPSIRIWHPLIELYLCATWRLNTKYSCPEMSTFLEMFRFTKIQKALLEYNRRNFIATKTLFSDILKSFDRFPMEGLPFYSDILFLDGDESKLEWMHQYCELIAAKDPISFYVTGNFLSLKRQYVTAAILFKKAARFNVWYAGSSWILAGHQYLQLRQPEAAVACYRRAIGKSTLLKALFKF